MARRKVGGNFPLSSSGIRFSEESRKKEENKKREKKRKKREVE